MISYETKKKLADFLLASSDGERQIEIVRQILAEQKDFEPYAAFRRLDRLRKAALSSADLVNFLADNSVYYTERQLRPVVRHYDQDGDGMLSYNEFLRLVLPQDNPTLRTLAT